MVIDFEHPGFQVLVDEDVEAKNLETVTLTLVPAPRKLELLLDEGEGLHRKQTLLAHLSDLLKKIVGVDLLLLAQEVQNRG